MPHRPALRCPSLRFLEEVERTFSVAWPESFRTFCRVHAGSSLSERYPGLKGRFIVDLDELEHTNRFIGEGSWGDYEQALGRERRPKDGRALYLGVLPFYVHRKDVAGFLISDSGNQKVALWAVHTIVHDYPTFDDWLSQEGGSTSHARPKRR